LFAALWRRHHVQRLKTRTQFQAVLAGATVSRTTHFVLHRAALGSQAPSLARTSTADTQPDSSILPPSAPSTVTRVEPVLFAMPDVWMGAMVPKRWAKRAVTRNVIKRQIYNVSSDVAATLPVAAHVVRLRAGFDRSHFVSATSDALKAAVRVELQQLFSKAGSAR
jgi:ribonuclease P protein component